jgi:uncharacterized protein (TIGR04255 family)
MESKGDRMSLPSPRLERLASSPLVSVAGEVRFEPCPQVVESKFIKEFRSTLLDSSRYSRLDPSSNVHLNVTAEGVVDRTEVRGWVLRDDAGHWSLSITPTNAVLETSSYSDWADFSVRLQELLEAVDRTLSPATCQRVGLRYIDKLIATGPAAGAGSWAGKIRGELLGLLNHPTIGTSFVTSEQRVILDLGGSESCILRHGSVPELPKPSYILDFDVFREGGSAFDSEAIAKTFDSLHLKGLALFQECLVQEYWNELLGDETEYK